MAEGGVNVAVPLVSSQSLIDDDVVHAFEEDACADETDAFEIVFGVQVQVVTDGRFQSGVSECDFVVVSVNADVRCECGVFGACDGVCEGTSHFEVFLRFPFDEE